MEKKKGDGLNVLIVSGKKYFDQKLNYPKMKCKKDNKENFKAILMR